MLIQSADMPNPGKILGLTWHKQDEELDIQVPEQDNKLCSRPNNIWRGRKMLWLVLLLCLQILQLSKLSSHLNLIFKKIYTSHYIYILHLQNSHMTGNTQQYSPIIAALYIILITIRRTIITQESRQFN
jgi:hypothetical protein